MNKKDRKRRSFKNKTGATVLSLLLVAALAVGGLSTYATEEDLNADAVATEETVPDDTGAFTEPGAEDTHPDPEITDDAADTTGDLANTDSQDSGNSAKSDSQDSAASAQGSADAAQTETTVDTSKISTAAADALQDDADTDDEDGDEETGDTLTADGLSDDTADVETASDWEATLPDKLTGVWADDLIEVAKSQLGYKESTKNYRVNDAGKHKGYTRYGAWYGDPYGDWCAMFVSFCLHYTDIPRSEFPEAASCWAWTKALDKLEMYEEADSGYEPVPGDLIFFDNNSKNEKPVDHVGIVTEITEETESDGSTVTKVHTIEGNSGNMVRERKYDITDPRIVGYGVLPENPDLEEEEEAEVLYGLDGGYDGSDSMDDPETAGSCVGWDEVATIASVSGSGWSMDDYYVGESNQYTVTETDNFSLKYQVEFHASTSLTAGSVKITIDASLGTYRNGNNILPTDLGIPYGTPDNPTSSSSSPFNYYYIDASGNILTASEARTASGVQLVIWNYRDIESGTNTMFQVLYKNLDIMQIPDNTHWSLSVKTSVNGSSVSGHTLSGTVDTSATLGSVTKTAYKNSSVSYTPELYTRKQVSRYIYGDIPDPYNENFDDYIYIVWLVTVEGSATQPYEITFTESAMGDTVGSGSVVGYLVNSSGTTSGVSYTYGDDGSLTFSSSTARTFKASFYVVTAYDAASYVEDSTLSNTVTAVFTPAEDSVQRQSATASTTWGEYVWYYKGNGISLDKWQKTVNGTRENTGTYKAHLDLYEINAANGDDTGEYPYSVETSDRGYGYTHILPTYDEVTGTYTMTSDVGEWIEGSYYTTTAVDDALYAYPDGDTSQGQMLTKDDYYFSAVTVTTSDSGYDVWEDETATAQQYDGVDQNVYIYAMFADGGGSGTTDSEWELVGTVPFSTGSMSYTFTESDLARQPYRVKAVHSTADYSSTCRITLGVTFRADSPILQDMIAEYGDDLTAIEVENLMGVVGQVYNNDNNGSYFGTGTASQYSEAGLQSFTEGLYGVLLARDNAYVILTELTETADAFKSVTTENDVVNGRVLANYYLTAYEAYYVTGESTVDSFKNAGVYLPDRQEVEYYDLLPYGMEFNPSTTVVAGRITTMNTTGSWKTNSGAWNKSGVSVSVTEDDVITNWNDTGRTLVKFHIHYSGDDASAFYDVPNSDDDLWFEGFGIYFQAYYDWSNIDQVDCEYNIAAYMANGVENEEEQFLGIEDSQIFKDDGTAVLSSDYAPFEGISDFNEDGVTDLYTNMYCKATTSTNVAVASSDSISKKVRADNDAVAEYTSKAIVETGTGYTYEVQLNNLENATLSGIVVFDKLEYAVEDGRPAAEKNDDGSYHTDSVFNGVSDTDINNHWTGTLLGVTTTALEDLGIEPVVYYTSTNRQNVVTGSTSVLTAANGWYTEEDFISRNGSLSAATAIAVDISTKTGGSSYSLGVSQSLSFQIHMLAPDDSDYPYAFNNPIYYSVSTPLAGGSATTGLVAGNAARVELGVAETLEVVKEFDPDVEVPDSMVNQRFTYEITRRGLALANQEYTTYTYNEETDTWESTEVVGSTGADGQFRIRANQKAVFTDLVDIDEVAVTEADNVMWDATYTGRTTSEDSDGNTVYTDTFVNRYRSPVYLHKTALTTALASSSTLNSARFTFYVEVDPDRDGTYEPYVGEYIYVKSVLTDGSSPSIDTSKGDEGYGYTSDGYITLGVSDIIVFFPTDGEGYYTNIPYRVTETAVQNADDWICEEDTTSGTTKATGTSVTIENYYKYRNLIITKDLLDYDHDFSDCDSEWTFKLTDANGDPVVGNHWYLIDSKGDTISGSGGTLSESGEFTFSGAGSGRRVVIEGLVAGEKYTLTEEEWDTDLFETVSGGTVTVTMPTYSVTRNTTITNQYLLKDLEVGKLVLSADTSSEVTTREFTFTLEQKNDGGTYTAMVGVTYYVDGEARTTASDGTFTLKSGETAVFDDIGYQGDVFRVTEKADSDYPQIYPSGSSYDSTLGIEGDSVRFINGDFEEVVVITKELSGVDDVGSAYADYVKADNTRATIDGGEEDDYAYTVDVTFGVYDGDNLVTSDPGELVPYEDYNQFDPFVYIKVTASGEVELYNYNGGLYTETISPYDSIYIAQIGGYTVKASENDDMALVIYEVSSAAAKAIGSDEIISMGSVMEGTAAANEDIVLVNEIGSANPESEIYKLMTETSGEVPAGSKITFRVEIYDEASGTWMPASGIRYITMDGYEGEYDTTDCYPTSGILTTGSDGQITLSKGESGYPYIRFVDDEVYVNVYEGMADGQLRIVELTSDSDDEWGWLSGYDGEGWVGGPALTVTYGDTFVDGNDDGLVFEVEKEMYDKNSSDQEFTFHLVHVVSATDSPITTLDQVSDSEVGAGVYYEIYTSSGARVGDGYTDENGCFTLQAGQYARFYVPEDTTWYVYEGMIPSWVLMDVTANSDKADNASIVDDVNGVVQNETSVHATGTLILTLTDADTKAALSGGTFDLYLVGEGGNDTLVAEGLVTDKNGQITVKGCEPGTYYFKETEAPSGYTIPEDDTSDTVTVPEGLTKVTEYEVGMENETKPYNVKYAVTLYGIQQDTYQADDSSTGTAGLTFGPATGKSYRNTYDAHLTKEQYDAGEGICLHWMTWDEIIAQSEKDPQVFQTCLENGCTHSVDITLNDTLLATSYEGQMDGGDGAGYLYNSINSEYRRWNGNSSSYTNSGGWPASKIRANMVGKDSYTNTTDASVAGDQYVLSADDCLFSCFPSVLQEGIVAKAVKSDTVYNDTSGNNVTTYDKLWLFSDNELYDGFPYRKNEGELYQRSTVLGITTSNYAQMANYNETGGNSSWWLRSPYYGSSNLVFVVNASGYWNDIYNASYASYGLAPGFCLK